MRRVLFSFSGIFSLCAVLLSALSLAAQVQGTWTKTGSSLDARIFSSQLTLAGGAIVIGGTVDGLNPLTSAELYSYSTGKWKYAVGSMATAREEFAAVALKTGKILVAGGMGAGQSVLTSAELYDPVSETWSSAGNLSVARFGDTATLLQNGQVLVAGGCNTNNCSAYAVPAELYNPATNSWSTVGALNRARFGMTATLLKSGEVLTVGGGGAFDTSTELYNPSTATWSYGPNNTYPRSEPGTVLLQSGKVLVTGGDGTKGTGAGTCELYDPGSNTWALTGSMKTVRALHTATLLTDGTVLVAGGEALHYYITSAAEIYDPASGVFTLTGSLNAARDIQTASLLNSGQVLTEGGQNAFGSLSSAEFYVPLTLAISSYSLNLGFEQLGVTSPPQTVTIKNVSNHSVTFTSPALSGDYAIGSNTCSGILEPTQSCAVAVTFTPSKTGTRAGSLTIKDNSAGSPKQTITLTGVGETNAISFSPSSLTFPGQTINTSSPPMNVSLINDGTMAVNITAIAISPGNGIFTETNNCPSTLNVNQSCTLQVVFTPPDALSYKATLAVTDNSANSPQKMALAGTGLDAIRVKP